MNENNKNINSLGSSAMLDVVEKARTISRVSIARWIGRGARRCCSTLQQKSAAMSNGTASQ
jgi:hypothetical protein